MVRHAMSDAKWRLLFGIFLTLAFCIFSFLAIRWIWRDITYWSRSATVGYETSSLEQCVVAAIAGWPGVSVLSSDPQITLEVPNHEGVIVKDTPTPKVARIVVYGHSESVSYLGPASEEPAAELLREFSHRISSRCGGLAEPK